MNLDPNDYTPTRMIVDMHGKMELPYDPSTTRHFTYFGTNFYMSIERDKIYQYQGVAGWTEHLPHYLPIEVVNAALLWHKANFQALPLHEFLSNTLNKADI